VYWTLVLADRDVIPVPSLADAGIAAGLWGPAVLPTSCSAAVHAAAA
jgi:hypothetical protein